jgi:hypothetical protein
MKRPSKSRAIKILKGLKEQIPSLRILKIGTQEFIEWRRNTKVAISNIFNDEPKRLSEINRIRFPKPIKDRISEDSYTHITSLYHEGLDRAEATLQSMINEIEDFWEEEGEEDNAPLGPFVSKSFDESDRELNDYITNILKALQIKYTTGESYSRDSIPKKVKSRIEASNLSANPPFLVL